MEVKILVVVVMAMVTKAKSPSIRFPRELISSNWDN